MSVGLALAIPLGAAAAQPDGARGNIGYNAYGLQRNARFDVDRDSNKCVLNVNGVYTFDFEYQSNHYIHDATITNESPAGSYNISGGYPAGGPYQFAWNGTGNVSGNTVTNSVNYTVGAPGTHNEYGRYSRSQWNYERHLDR